MGTSAFKLISPGSDGKSVRNTITFDNHGFVGGDVLRYYIPVGGGSEGWTGAFATSSIEAEVAGVVESVTQNSFVLVYGGEISFTDFPAGITLEGNDVFFLSDIDPGKITAIPPINGGHVIKPVITRTSDSIGIVTNYVGTAIGGRATVSLDSVQPVGTIMPYAGDIAMLPDSWELCDGGYVPIDTYVELYERIGTKFGTKQTAIFGVVPADAIVDATVVQGAVTGIVESVVGTTVTIIVDTLSLNSAGNEVPNGNLFDTNSNLTFQVGNASSSAAALSVSISHIARPNLKTRNIIGTDDVSYVIGELGGSEESLISSTNLPANIFVGSSSTVFDQNFDAQSQPGVGVPSAGGGQGLPIVSPFLSLYYIIKVNSYAKASYIDGLDINIGMAGLADTDNVIYGSGDVMVYDGDTNLFKPYQFFTNWFSDADRTIQYLNPTTETLPWWLGITGSVDRGNLMVGGYEQNIWNTNAYGAGLPSSTILPSSVLTVVGDLALGHKEIVPSKICSNTWDGLWGSTLDYSTALTDFAATFPTDPDRRNNASFPSNVIDLWYQSGYFFDVNPNDPSYNSHAMNGAAYVNQNEFGYNNSIHMSSVQGFHVCVDSNQTFLAPGGVSFYRPHGYLSQSSSDDAVFTIGMGGLGFGPRGGNTGGYDTTNQAGNARNYGTYSEILKIVGDSGRLGFLMDPSELNPDDVATNTAPTGSVHYETGYGAKTGIGISGGVKLRRGTIVDGITNDIVGIDTTSNDMTNGKHDLPTAHAVKKYVDESNNYNTIDGLFQTNYTPGSPAAIDIVQGSPYSSGPNNTNKTKFVGVNLNQGVGNITDVRLTPANSVTETTIYSGAAFGDGAQRYISFFLPPNASYKIYNVSGGAVGILNLIEQSL